MSVGTEIDTRTYRVHHRGSKFRGEVVRLTIRPHAPGKGGPTNVRAVVVSPGEHFGEWFVCPFRGLKRVR